MLHVLDCPYMPTNVNSVSKISIKFLIIFKCLKCIQMSINFLTISKCLQMSLNVPEMPVNVRKSP
jgi:hypothetical protein